MIGKEIQGRFRVLRVLGEGGMGVVYEGENIKIGRKVAIKVLHPQFARNPEVVQRFHQEARAAAAIGHPNIIEVLDMGELEDGSSYMVLEYLHGQDWSDEIEASGPQPLGRVASILVQVCDALQAAHTQGIIHRDLKPENIYLIDRHGRDDFVKVLDFGISKVLPSDGEQRALTQTNMMLGTAYYMSPEQTRAAKHIDHRSDIYTLGVILFQALTGFYPFDDAALPMLFVKICTEDPPTLSTYRSDLPSQLESIFRKLIAKDPKARYQSCAQIKAALEPFVDHELAPDLVADAPDPKLSPVTSLLAAEEKHADENRTSTEALLPQRTSRRGALFATIGIVVLSAASAPLWFSSEADATQEEVPAIQVERAPPIERSDLPIGESVGDEDIQIVAYASDGPSEGVSIYVDGEEHLGDSLRLDVLADGSLHTYEARAEGYQSEVRRVAHVVSASVELPLTRRRVGSRSMRAVGTMVATPMVTTPMTVTPTTVTPPEPVETPPVMEDVPMMTMTSMTIEGGSTEGFGH